MGGREVGLGPDCRAALLGLARGMGCTLPGSRTLQGPANDHPARIQVSLARGERLDRGGV